MNLLTKKSGLLFLLAALVIFSCKKEPSRIGNSLQPPDIQTDLSFTDSLKAQTSTVLVNDSIVTSRIVTLNILSNSVLTNVYGLVGQSKDPVFGRITSKTFGQLKYNIKGSFSFGDNPVLDSAVFTLLPAGYYGDTLPANQVDQSISVYQLTGSLDTGIVYKATSPEIPYDVSKKLATFNFPANQTVPASISVKLTNEDFAKGIIANGITSDSALLVYCKGVALVAENKDAVVRRFYLFSGSGMKIYYHNDKTYSSVTLNLSYNNPKFYTIEADRSGTPLAGLGNQSYGTEITGNLSYVQAGTGVMTKLSFPGLENFLKEMKDGEQIIINKAEIVIKADQNYKFGYPVNRINLYQTGENGKMLKINNASAAVQANGYYLFGTENPSTANYDYTNNLYKFSIGSYLQAVADKKIVLRPFLVGATETILKYSDYSVENGPLNFYSLDRSVLKNDTSVEADRIKLNIYYTIVK
ncbi:DUF4270 family protein [Sporocytophaga myxococcoides]|uniref:DUF4270 family protein n=1 Tax=Sporocytophaga myxococcoides TaxID=153721 RepID=UPI00041F393F|nr:DUF4270 family protein [Sporocytophaga myxococcoides]